MYIYILMLWSSLFIKCCNRQKDEPEAVLIRGVEGYDGPGKLTKAMQIDKTLNGADLTTSDKIWIEDSNYKPSFVKTKRIGIDYASEPYKSIEWRFVVIE